MHSYSGLLQWFLPRRKEAINMALWKMWKKYLNFTCSPRYWRSWNDEKQKQQRVAVGPGNAR